MSLRILSHNAFWFEGAPFESDNPGDPNGDIVAALAGIYRKIEPDFICLQEIQSQKAFETLSVKMGLSGSYCQGGTYPQYGGAVLWQNVAPPVRDSAGLGAAAQRMWQIFEVKLSRGRNIHVCNIHLSSGRQLGREMGARQRLTELAEVVQHKRPPDIIIGDFNEMPGGPVNEYMKEKKYMDAAVLTQQESVPTNLGGGRGDYIWVRADLRGSVVEYAVLPRAECCYSRGEIEYVSDHLPLWVTLDLEEE